MKPTSQIIDEADTASATERRFPVTDFNYHSAEMSASHYTNSESNSFLTSLEYFKNEAPRDFLSEAAVFGVIMLTAALPLLNGLHAVVDLIRATSGI